MTPRTLREALGLSQAEVADRLGVHMQTLSKWERGALAAPRWLSLALRGIKAEEQEEDNGRPTPD